MNYMVIDGNLTTDPELRCTKTGTDVCSVTIAHNDGYGDQQKTFFPTVIAWKHLGKYLAKYATKGTRIIVVGKYTERPWEDKQGKKRISPEIVASEITIVPKVNKGESGQDPPIRAGEYTGFTELPDEELPF